MDMMKNKQQNKSIHKQGSATMLVCAAICLCGFLSACATPPLPPPPPKYVHSQEKGPQSSANSLWADNAGLYENVKARRLNDLVTINVVENISGTGTANTNTSRESTIDIGVDSVFGLPLNFNKANMFGQAHTFLPAAAASSTSEFTGTGNTTRVGRLVGTLTAKVVEVMPNGNFVLESRKDITINNEKQILILRGMVRPEDIALDNTILSSRVADAQVFFVGDGVVQQKQKPGWLVQVLDVVWPF